MRITKTLFRWLGAGAMALFAVAAGTSAEPVFEAARLMEVDHDLEIMTSADLNRDSLADLIVAGSELSVNYGFQAYTSDGRSFTLSESHFDLPPVTDMAVGDLNGDDDPDLVIAHRQMDVVSVFTGVGDGTLLLVGQFPAGDGPNSVALGFVDGDSLLDAVVANQVGGTVGVLLGVGDGTFESPALFGSYSLPWSAGLGDLNDDGNADIVVADYWGRHLHFLAGDGAGSFTPGDSTAVEGKPVRLRVEDLDGDDRSDVAVVLNDARLLVTFAGDGSGLPSEPAASVITGGSPMDVVFADLDGNDDLDALVMNSQARELSLYMGTGGGGLDGPEMVHTVSKPHGVAAGDFDHDGTIDVAASIEGTSIYDEGTWLWFARGRGDGTLEIARRTSIGRGPVGVAADFFTQDGIIDLVVGTNLDTTLAVYHGDGTGGFTEIFSTLTPGRIGQLVAHDFNGDTYVDVAITLRTQNSVAIYEGTSDGELQPEPSVSYPTEVSPRLIAAAKLNDDDYIDLGVATYIGDAAEIFLGDGNGTFEPIGGPLPVGDRPSSMAFGDFNEDEIEDLAVSAELDSIVVVRLGNGDGTFAGAVEFMAGVDPTSMTVVDFDQDTHLDIVVANQSMLYFTVLNGDGTGDFVRQVIPLEDRCNRLIVGDVDTDAILDLVVFYPNSNRVVVYPGLAPEIFGDPMHFDGDETPSLGLLADFNGDTADDLVVLLSQRPIMSVFMYPDDLVPVDADQLALVAFDADAVAGRGVFLSWALLDARDDVTFFIDRARHSRGPWSRIADGLGADPPGGSRYLFLDEAPLSPGWYLYRLGVPLDDGTEHLWEPVVVRVGAAPARDGIAFPNPFGTATSIPFDVPTGGAEVRIEIFDAGGRRVATLTDERYSSGRHTLMWSGLDSRGRELPSGFYFLKLLLNEREITRPLTLIR